MSYSDCAYMHGHCSICIIMHNFTPTDVGVFLVKMCKMKEFLYYRKVSTNWCGCSYNLQIAILYYQTTKIGHYLEGYF